ncbi:MAG: helicase-related protein, partial [Thermoplasmata archaeon]|nr:helicase-related protein [Thermoplasmata archaeon]
LEEKPDKVWDYDSLIDELNSRAMDQGIFTGGAFKRDDNRIKAAWFIDEEFASTQQRRSSLENLGLAKIHYEALETKQNDEFITTWAGAFHLSPQEIINIIRVLLDYYRRRGLINEPLLTKEWTSNDKEVFTGLISVAEHYAPRALLATGISDQTIRKYKLTWQSEKGQAGAQQVVNKIITKGNDEIDNFLEKLLAWLIKNKYLVKSNLTKKAHGKIIQIKLPSEAYQINHKMVGIQGANERYVCTSCRRAQSTALPTGKCPEWRCIGQTERRPLDPENYDIYQYTKLNFVPLKTYEHSAQVPKEMREKVEREFKRTDGEFNCIVCTPTLELGVDIGQLEMAIMRNVPPTPANYSQRAGRAGRRHRIAVIFTYARGTQHDRYFFKDPPAMITGDIRVPAFSMKNAPLITKHIHSAALTKLRELASPEEKDILDDVLPTFISEYLGFYPKDDFEKTRFRQYKQPKNVDGLKKLISNHKEKILESLILTFQNQWPKIDSEHVSKEILDNNLNEMPEALQFHVNRLYFHFSTYTRKIKEYAEIERRNEALTSEESRERMRFQKSREWFLDKENRDTYTLTYLCDDGFLPGYALGRDSCLAQAFGDPFIEISRPPSIALREFTPSNWIYANKDIFQVQRLNFYKFTQESSNKDELSIDVGLNLSKGRVFSLEANEMEGGEDTRETLKSYELTELELKKLQSIDDKSEARRYVGFEIQGMFLRMHKGGFEGKIADREFQYLNSEHIRIFNLGPKRLVAKGNYGFPICPACGETRNPESSEVEISNFTDHHKKYCKISDISKASLHVESISDVIILKPFEEHKEAVNVMEAIRIGAKEVLDMTSSDIDGFITQDENDIYNAVLFDPMPGGSGFLPQILNLWERIVETSINMLKKCDCDVSCYSCLRHFRNQQHHDELDRNLAIHLLNEMSDQVKTTNQIPERVIPQKVETGMADSPPEIDFIKILENHKFPLPEKDHKFIPQEDGLDMEADYYYPEQRVIVVIDGLSIGIHGNSERQQKDQLQRAKARMKRYHVLELSAKGLKDDTYIRGKLEELA